MTAVPDVKHSACGAAHRKWWVVTPPGARWFAVGHSLKSRARVATALRALPPGAPVVLCDNWPLSRRRCRKLARRGGVCVVREYLALPTLGTAVALIQDTPTTARYAATRLLAVPPKVSRPARLAGVALPVARWILCRSSRSVVFGGRVMLGARA